MKRILFMLLLLSNICMAQNKQIDSVLQVIKESSDDSVKIALYNQIAWKYIFNDKEKALETLKKTEAIASKKGQEYGYNSYLNVMGVFYDVNGMSDSAQFFFEKSLQYSRDQKFVVHESHSLNNLGMFSWNKGNYEAALSYYFKSLALADKSLSKNKEQEKDANYNNIGLIYQDMELYEKAIPYLQKALKIRKETNNIQGQATTYNNLGICFFSMKDYDAAQKSFENGMAKAKEIKDETEYFRNAQGLADVYSLQQNNTKAIALYLESYNRPKHVPFSSKDKVHVTSGLSELYLRNKSYLQSINYGEFCIAEINKDTTTNYYELDVYESLATAYYAVGNTTKGAFYNQAFYKRTAEKFKESTAKSLQELETKYNTQKKELALQKSQAAVKQKNLYLFSALGLALLLGLIGYLVYKQERIKNEQLVKETKLEQALVKIEHQNNLHEQRLAISKELHDNVGSQLTFIISSLDNLKQFDVEHEHMFSKIDSIGGFTRDTINDLRDTIWAMNKEEINFEDLQERTTRFIERAKFSVENIDFKFNYPIQYEETALNSKLGIDVYRIIQEAVNNAIKHSSANEISVNFDWMESEVLEIVITDNGKGFDLDTSTEGYGLHSMKKRAEKINADFAITTSNVGTTITIKFATV